MSGLQGLKVLITGGLGFIGSNLARRLVDTGSEVVIVDSLIPNHGGSRFNIEGYEDRLTVNISDVRDQQSMKHLVSESDVLFNLAGQTSHMDSMADPMSDLEINCRAQLSLLETCRSHNPGIKVIFASTRQIYGRQDSFPITEQSVLRPVDVNGINKMAGEWYHILYNNVYGIRACSLRLTNTIGPRMRVKDARQTFLGVWIRLALRDEAFEVWGGEQLRDFTYIDDCIDALLLAAESEKANGGIYNLGCTRTITLKDLAQLVVDSCGSGRYEVVPFPEDRKKIDIGDYYSDDSLIREELGWAPEVTLEDAIGRTVDYYRENLDHYL